MNSASGFHVRVPWYTSVHLEASGGIYQGSCLSAKSFVGDTTGCPDGDISPVSHLGAKSARIYVCTTRGRRVQSMISCRDSPRTVTLVKRLRRRRFTYLRLASFRKAATARTTTKTRERTSHVTAVNILQSCSRCLLMVGSGKTSVSGKRASCTGRVALRLSWVRRSPVSSWFRGPVHDVGRPATAGLAVDLKQKQVTMRHQRRRDEPAAMTLPDVAGRCGRRAFSSATASSLPSYLCFARSRVFAISRHVETHAYTRCEPIYSYNFALSQVY